jgi:hypothetical protein
VDSPAGSGEIKKEIQMVAEGSVLCGAVDGARPEESTPTFAEMAVPGTTFEGDWQEKTFFLEPEVRRSIRWPEGFNRAKVFEAVNTNPDYRQILEQFGFYNRALASNLPFPKTRRIVFLNNKPATLPGWAELSIDG